MEYQQESLQKWGTYKQIKILITLPLTSLLLFCCGTIFFHYYQQLSLTSDLLFSLSSYLLSLLVIGNCFRHNLKWSRKHLVLFSSLCVILFSAIHYQFLPTTGDTSKQNTICACIHYKHSNAAIISSPHGKVFAFLKRPGCTIGNQVVLKKIKLLNSKNSFERSMQRKGVRFSATISKINLIDKERTFSIRERLRSKLSHTIDIFYRGDANALLKALIFGKKKYLSTRMLYTYKKAGLLHMLAASGMHVGIISALLFLILQFLTIPKNYSFIICSIAIAAYLLMTELPVSLLRAAIMFWIYTLYTIAGVKRSAINALISSALIIIINNPFELYSLGFHLSFWATLSILICYQSFKVIIPNIPFKINSSLALSCSAQLTAMPIITIVFLESNGVSLFSTIIATPLLIIFIYSALLQLLFQGTLSCILLPIGKISFTLLDASITAFSSINLHYSIPQVTILLIAPLLLLCAVILPITIKLRTIFLSLFLLVIIAPPIFYNYWHIPNYNYYTQLKIDNHHLTVECTSDLKDNRLIINDLYRINSQNITLNIYKKCSIQSVLQIIKLFPVENVIFIDRIKKVDYFKLIRILKNNNISYRNTIFKNNRVKQHKRRSFGKKKSCLTKLSSI